jgi:hypothetical protein
MIDANNVKREAENLQVICEDIRILSHMGEHFDQLGPDEHSAVFASIRLLCDQVSTGLEGIARTKAEGEYIHLNGKV